MAIPPPINIKTEDFIDLDNYKCNDEKIQIWLKSVFDQIKVSFGFECQTSLESLMKWYIDSLNTEVINIDITRNFSMKLEKHLFLFHRNFKRFNCISNDTYLEYMEDILAFYLDCEVKRFVNEKKRQKKNKQFMRSRILNLLNVYLLNHKSRYHHVIMKMRADISSDEAKSCLDNIYRVIFSRKPHSKSDQAFCTAFILYERWKKTLPPDCWPTLEDLIKELYSRHPSTIQTNSVWKEITSSNESFIETIAQFGNNDKAVCDAYFKYVKSKSMDESVEMVNKDANPTEEPSTSGIGTIQVDSESEVENILKNCENIEAVEVKKETAKNDKNGDKTDDDDDDDCIIVSDDPMYVNPEDLVFEILDDDDEDENSTGKEAGANSSNSFLDSIAITAKASTVQNDNPTIEPVSSALVKSQSLVKNDETIESKDILSGKVTEKKDVEQEFNITDEANNITEEANNISEDSNVITEETNNISEESNNITDSSQLSQLNNFQNLDKNGDFTLHSPHSTYSSELISTNPSESYTYIEPVSSALVESQNFVKNDETIESKDFLSGKVTEKKDVEQEFNITDEANNITEEANNISEEINDISEDSNVITKETNNISEESNNINDSSQLFQLNNFQNLDKNGDFTLHSPHSTYSSELISTNPSESSPTNTPTNTSPTSPDISSTMQDLTKEAQHGVDQSHKPSVLYETVVNTSRGDSGVDQIEEMPDTTPAISSTIIYTQKVDNLSWGGNFKGFSDDVVNSSTPTREQKQAGSLSHSSPTSNFKGYLSNFQSDDENKPVKERKEGGRKRKRVVFSGVNTVHLVSTGEPEAQAIPYDQVLNDPLLKRKPVVIVEKLSKMEIDGWQNVSEGTRKKQRFENTGCMKVYHVIYDKSKNNDQFFYKGADDCNWRQTQEPKLIKKEGRDMNNGKFVEKRKFQKNTISQKNPEVRKRGRPRKNI